MNNDRGAQRLTLEALHRWEKHAYGMFIHFGMSTFEGIEMSKGDQPSTYYAPTNLDVDQWVQVARDAGMTYAILTAKHVSGHALWPTRHSDYHVGTSGHKVDVVDAFVKACDRRGVRPGLYYCSWDNHHKFDSFMPMSTPYGNPYTTQKYRDFQMAQVDELLTQYGDIFEMWIDIPGILGHDGRKRQYEQIVSLQPNAYIMMNQGIGDGSKINYDYAWPTDLMAIERFLPNSDGGYKRWHEVPQLPSNDVPSVPATGGASQRFYIPGEVCDPIGSSWFAHPTDRVRSDAELLGMRLIARARNTNLLLNVPPSTRGVIEKPYIDALDRLRVNIERFGATGMDISA
jgi:alpha-L-fucosidase